ncbi:glycosyl transferase [Secundilactobacillus pentosiphilus]|uniref:Glycosyl transferase n=1 Tax=Secundilactobacillus pentosiphilus TaxID=1714682 RepID=A0A1Z5ITZ1_9LACO|nr:glycosyltransferase [Secundilactobacillus pentosiphilus]GAX05146.1 glycosyl transferase [Secundilactobacillus pentosiphilus]
MQVLEVGDFLKASGMTKYIFNVIGQINRSEMHIDVLAISGSDECKKIVRGKNWGFFKVSAVNKHPLKNFFQSFLFFKENAKNYDVIHFHETAMWNFWPVLFAHFFGAKHIVLNSHNTYFATNGNKIVLKVLEYLHIFGKHLINRFLEKKIAVSMEAAKWMFTKKTIRNKDYIIIPNAIKLTSFDFDKQIRAKKRYRLGISDDVTLYGNVGILNKRKNQTRLIEIFSQILKSDRNSLLLIIGEGPARNKLEKQINCLGLENSVMLLGNQDNVNDFYQAMDVLIMPSLHEGLSTVLLEAQVSGVKIFPSSEIPLGDYMKDIVFPISLEKSDVFWSKYILNHLYGTRVSHLSFMKDRGYDLKSASERTYEAYLEVTNFEE